MHAIALLSLLPLALGAPTKRAPLYIPEDAELLEGKYIIKLKSPEVGIASTASAKKLIESTVDKIDADADYVYEKIGGFAASLTEEEVEALRSNPNVCVVGARVNMNLR
jgi:hypothetical protein